MRDNYTAKISILSGSLFEISLSIMPIQVSQSRTVFELEIYCNHSSLLWSLELG